MAVISLIIPVFNCKTYLKSCVERLLKLEDHEIEILLIDDGSTDGSSELCDQLSEQHDRIRCIHQENGGVSAARNRGIEEAAGDWLMFVDADDSINTDMLLKLLEEADTDPELDAVFFGMSFDYYLHGKNYRTDRLAVPETLKLDRAQWAEIIPNLYSANYLSSVCNKLFERSILQKNNIRFNTDLFLLEDLDFSLRYLACCDTILCSDLIVYHYRQAEDEGNAGRRLKRIDKLSLLVDKLKDLFSQLALCTGKDEESFRQLVTGIFLMLARQKIAVSDRKTVREICRDFSAWINENNIPGDELSSELAQDLLNGRVFKLIAKRDYSKLRHSAANRWKYLRFLARGLK